MKVLNGFLSEFAIFNLPKDGEGEEFSLDASGDDTTDGEQDQALAPTGDTPIDPEMGGEEGEECVCKCECPCCQSKKDDKSSLDGNPNIDVVPGDKEELGHDDDELDDEGNGVKPQGVDPDDEDEYKFI